MQLPTALCRYSWFSLGLSSLPLSSSFCPGNTPSLQVARQWTILNAYISGQLMKLRLLVGAKQSAIVSSSFCLGNTPSLQVTRQWTILTAYINGQLMKLRLLMVNCKM